MLAAAYITTANVWVFSLILVGLFLAFVAFWLASFALFRAMVDECAEAWGRPVRQILGGLGPTLVLIIGGLALVNVVPQPPLKLIASLLVAIPILAGFVGSAGLALRIGRGLQSGADGGDAWRHVRRGGIVLWLTFLFPVFGWLFIWPLVLTGGFGALLGRWRARRRSRHAIAEVQPPGLPAETPVPAAAAAAPPAPSAPTTSNPPA